LLAQVKNEIESFVFEAQDRLEQREYKLCSTEDERVQIAAKLSEASDWLIEQDDSTPRKVATVRCHIVAIVALVCLVHCVIEHCDASSLRYKLQVFWSCNFNTCGLHFWMSSGCLICMREKNELCVLVFIY